MAFKDWSDDKFTNLSITIVLVSAGILLTILIIAAWITSNIEYKIYTDHKYQKCLVFNPNNNEETMLWQHTCQEIPAYYTMPVIRNKKD